MSSCGCGMHSSPHATPSHAVLCPTGRTRLGGKMSAFLRQRERGSEEGAHMQAPWCPRQDSNLRHQVSIGAGSGGRTHESMRGVVRNSSGDPPLRLGTDPCPRCRPAQWLRSATSARAAPKGFSSRRSPGCLPRHIQCQPLL